MAQIRGRNFNTNDSASVTEITTNPTTSTTAAAANKDRTYLHIDNNSNVTGVWVKLQAATEDDDKKGIYLSKNIAAEAPGTTYWEMTPDNIYTGEVSVIADSGTPSVHVTEY